MVIWICVGAAFVVLFGLTFLYDRRHRGHNAHGMRSRRIHSDRQSSDAALQGQVNDMKNTFGPSP